MDCISMHMYRANDERENELGEKRILLIAKEIWNENSGKSNAKHNTLDILDTCIVHD